MTWHDRDECVPWLFRFIYSKPDPTVKKGRGGSLRQTGGGIERRSAAAKSGLTSIAREKHLGFLCLRSAQNTHDKDTLHVHHSSYASFFHEL